MTPVAPAPRHSVTRVAVRHKQAAAKPHRHRARAHHVATHRTQPAHKPFLSGARLALPLPALPVQSSGGHGVLDGNLLIFAASMLLLVVVLGGSLLALTAGQARSARP
ncbi:MAG TPA: hypothetical protein VGI67_10160 [Thermoleophilaceae bacterium]